MVNDEYEPRLLQCKGARTVRVTTVPLTNASLNNGDVFILDLGLSIYVFNAPGANRMERRKGTEVANQINSDERSGRAKVCYTLCTMPQPTCTKLMCIVLYYNRCTTWMITRLMQASGSH